jgi:hypothetical protein
MPSTIRLSIGEGVAVVTLADPSRRNAFSETRNPSITLARYAHRSDSPVADAIGERADVGRVGSQDDSAPHRLGGSHHDRVDRGRNSCHPGKPLEPRRRTGNQISDGSDLYFLQHLVRPGVTLVAEEGLSQGHR